MTGQWSRWILRKGYPQAYPTCHGAASYKKALSDKSLVSNAYWAGWGT